MRISVFALLLLAALSVSSRADTLSVSFTDFEGRTCSADIVIDDETGHPVAIAGTDYEGRSYSSTLQTFAAEFDGCGSTIRYHHIGRYWYLVSPGDNGVLCGIGRIGGPVYGSPQFSYRVSDAGVQDEGPAEARPIHE